MRFRIDRWIANSALFGVSDASSKFVRPDEKSDRELRRGNMGTMTAQVNVDMHNTVTEELISARRLWTAVLVNAVEDWRTGTLRARREAQAFLFENDEDFELVCTAAGLDSNDFRVRLLKVGPRIEMRAPSSVCFAT
jgi:hypothetical protein